MVLRMESKAWHIPACTPELYFPTTGTIFLMYKKKENPEISTSEHFWTVRYDYVVIKCSFKKEALTINF